MLEIYYEAMIKSVEILTALFFSTSELSEACSPLLRTFTNRLRITLMDNNTITQPQTRSALQYT